MSQAILNQLDGVLSSSSLSPSEKTNIRRFIARLFETNSPTIAYAFAYHVFNKLTIGTNHTITLQELNITDERIGAFISQGKTYRDKMLYALAKVLHVDMIPDTVASMVGFPPEESMMHYLLPTLDDLGVSPIHVFITMYEGIERRAITYTTPFDQQVAYAFSSLLPEHPTQALSESFVSSYPLLAMTPDHWKKFCITFGQLIAQRRQGHFSQPQLSAIVGLNGSRAPIDTIERGRRPSLSFSLVQRFYEPLHINDNEVLHAYLKG